MRILITNGRLTTRTGTETYVRDLALGLRRRGHVPVIYSPAHGAIAHELQAAKIFVTDNLKSIREAPDVIHGHHHPQTMAALLRFSGVPGIFVCHDRLAWHDAPPQFPRILRYVAVDDNCRERLLENNFIPNERIRVVLNSVDLERFKPRLPLPAEPKRALAFSNYVGENNILGVLREACVRAGLFLDARGGRSGNTCVKPEEVLGQYDIVFAKARCALEALATGAAVVLCDTWGAGPLVTSDKLSELRRLNFGWRTLTHAVSVEALAAEIARYNAKDAAEVTRRIRTSAGLEGMIDELLALYQEVIQKYADADKAGAVLKENFAAAAYFKAWPPKFELKKFLRPLKKILSRPLLSNRR